MVPVVQPQLGKTAAETGGGLICPAAALRNASCRCFSRTEVLRIRRRLLLFSFSFLWYCCSDVLFVKVDHHQFLWSSIRQFFILFQCLWEKIVVFQSDVRVEIFFKFLQFAVEVAKRVARILRWGEVIGNSSEEIQVFACNFVVFC